MGNELGPTVSTASDTSSGLSRPAALLENGIEDEKASAGDRPQLRLVATVQKYMH